MGRIGISYHEVAKAISTLQSLQKNPTVDHIREILGTGSKSTIARFLREWKAKNGLQNDDDGMLPGELLGIVKGLWGKLQEKADNQTALYKQECDEKIAQLQQQLNHHHQQQSDSQLKIQMLEEQAHQKTEALHALKQELTVEQHEKIKITERALSLESRRNESFAENERLHQLLKHVQENLEHYQLATQQLRQEQSLLIEKQRNDYEQKLLQAQKQIESISTEKTNYQAQYIQLNKIHEQSELDQKELVLRHKKIEQQYELLKMAHEKMQKDHEHLSTAHQQQSLNLENKHHELIELQLKLKAEDEKIIVLENELTKANDKINSLRHDHQFTSQEKANLEGQLKQLQSILSSKTQLASQF